MLSGFRRILCPVDASECSRRALRSAVDLAGRFSGEVEVLHVYQLPAYIQPGVLVWAAVGPRTLAEVADEQAQTDVEGLLAGFSSDERAKLRVTREIGDAAAVIVERARSQPIDLLVMGTHGRTGVRRFLMGSVAERVLRLAPCPVLVVPLNETAKDAEPGRLVDEVNLKGSEGAQR
ncbi:MAG: universal stress protein [Myxococcales bacterium]|nr:universal stress protein [Myxococcales bacterium]